MTGQPGSKTQQKTKAEPSNPDDPSQPGKPHGNSYAKDSQPVRERGQNGRDRDSVRGERIRGGHRGRGGHSHSQSYGGMNGNTYHVDSSRQGPFGPTVSGNMPFMSGTVRGRGLGRGGYVRNNQATGQSGQHLTGGMDSGNRIHPIMTDLASYTYPINPPSAPPYPQPTPAQLGPADYSLDVHRLTLLTKQIDYWFSLDNLVKDIYLRKHMDSSGYVHMNVVTRFNRLRILEPTLEDVRNAVAHSHVVDLWCAGDGIERIRARQGWEMFTLPVEARFEEGKTDRTDYFRLQSEDHVRQFHYPQPSTPPYYQHPSFPQSATDPNGFPSHVTPVQYPVTTQPPYSGGTVLAPDAPEFAPSTVINGDSWNMANGPAHPSPG